ncbi:MAG: hypothetical protein C0483_16510 [Pirellula sp.]|nr:hypothetical protein [Pirellula sp.]
MVRSEGFGPLRAPRLNCSESGFFGAARSLTYLVGEQAGSEATANAATTATTQSCGGDERLSELESANSIAVDNKGADWIEGSKAVRRRGRTPSNRSDVRPEGFGADFGER